GGGAAERGERVVVVKDFAKRGEERALLDVLNAADVVGRPFVMSRQVPPDRIAILRKAFNATMKDKVFLVEMEKQQLPVIPLSGEEAETVVAKLMNVPPAIVAKAKEIYD